jgi:hypothetical protein
VGLDQTLGGVGPGDVYTEDRKERKGMNEPRIEGSPNPKSVLAIFAISVCKIPVRKRNSHRGRKERKEMNEPRIEGSPNPKSVCDLCDLRV